jgi:uncharacterized membrane protein
MSITTLTRAAKSAKGRLALTLLGGLVALGATTVLGAPKPTFSLSASPATQTVAAGQNANYSVLVSRQNKHTGNVSLAVSGLPASAKATATFNPQPISNSGTSSTLTVKTNQGGTTPVGTYTLTVSGMSGSAASSTSVRLTVVSAAQPNFTLAATPNQSVISSDDSSSHQIGITRTGGFTQPVALSVTGLPNGVTGQFTPNPAGGSSSTLNLVSDHNPKPGAYLLTVTGTAFAPGQITRSTSLTLTVEEKKAFEIAGDATEQLVPGLAVPLDLALANPHNFTLQVQEIAVSVSQTSAAGCDADDNYSVEQIPAGRYPLSIPAKSTRKLSELGVGEADQPTVTMRDLASVNQDACKGASVFFDYTGGATK